MGAQQTEPTPSDESEGSERDPTLPPGSAFGAYAIVRCIGRGGMGAVYEAKHRELGKRVALKALHRRIADDPRARARFVTEGRATSRLRHPHVVDVSDHGILNGVPYLVMEFLEGETLAEVIARDGALSVTRTVEVMLPVCAAVTATHAEGIVHRDLKPANIFLSRDGLGREQVKVLDFGVSKVDSLDVDGLTATGALIGTPWYMSPEQAQDPRSAQAPSDQYTLGVILSECVTGRRAFDGKSLYVVLRNIVSGTMVTPRAVRPEIPEGFEAVVMRAASVDISARYASVDDLARALLPFASPPSRASWGPIFHADPPAVEEPPPVAPPPPVDVVVSPPTPDPDSLQAVVRPMPPSRRRAALVGGLLLATGAAAVLWWVATPRVPATPVSRRPLAPVVVEPAPVIARAPDPSPAPVPVVASPDPAPVVAPPVVVAPIRSAPRPRSTVRTARRQLGANGAPIEE